MNIVIRPRSFGAIAVDAEALVTDWPAVVEAFTPLAEKKLVGRYWYLNALRRRVGEILEKTPELLRDIASTREEHRATEEERERVIAAELAGDMQTVNTITAAVMSRPGVPETGIERARRIFASIDHVCRIERFLARVNGPDAIPKDVIAAELDPDVATRFAEIAKRFAADIELMQQAPDEGETAFFRVIVPGPGSYPIATGVVHVEPLERRVPLSTPWAFAIELSTRSKPTTLLLPHGHREIEAIGGDVYRIEVVPT